MPVEHKHSEDGSHPIPGMIFAGMLVLAVAAVLALLSVLRFVPALVIDSKTEDSIPSLNTVPAFDTSLLLMCGIVILLIGIFGILAIAVLCCCGRITIRPPIPNLSKIASALRSVAAILDQGAEGISTANDVVDPARQALVSMTGITVPVPKFRSLGDVNLGFFNGEVWVPDGIEQKSLTSLIDDATEQKLEDFANDVTGKTVLNNASTTLRQQVLILEGQADALDSLEF